jgi:hypothetical protein
MFCLECLTSNPANFSRKTGKCKACHHKAQLASLEHHLLGLPANIPERVSIALNVLSRARSAYRALATGGSAAALRLALKQKTMALIRHDRILRCEVHQ